MNLLVSSHKIDPFELAAYLLSYVLCIVMGWRGSLGAGRLPKAWQCQLGRTPDERRLEAVEKSWPDLLARYG